MKEPQWRAQTRLISSSTRSPAVLSTLSLSVALLAPLSAFAATSLGTRAEVHYEDNSNLFDLAPGGISQEQNGDHTRGDSYTSYGGALTADYAWSRQDLELEVDGREIRYQHFSDLDHPEYRLKGDLNWKLGRNFDGSVGIHRDRSMVPFYDLLGTQLSLQTDQIEHVAANMRLASDWQLQTRLTESKSDSPRPGLPNLALREDMGQLGAQFAGHAGLSLGVNGQYTHGTYTGAQASLEPAYHQIAFQGTGSYSRNPASAVDFAAGYTSRSSAVGVDNLSGFTGQLGYERSLTPKTSVKFEISRAINSYITNRGSEIDTAGTGRLTWQATRRFAVSTRYSYTYSQLPAQGTLGSDRIDHFKIYQLNADYHLFSWLDLQPYARWESRGSSYQDAHYAANIYGIYGYLLWQTAGTLVTY